MTRAADRWFVLALAVLGGSYVLLVAALLAVDVLYTSPGQVRAVLDEPYIRAAIRLSVLSATVTTILALWVAVPLGYLLSRTAFPGKAVVELLVDVPLVLPPLVVGISLLVLFQTAPGRVVEAVVPVTYRVPAVILAQFAVVTAFAVRTMRVTFDGIDPRAERVALTLGCSRAGAFRRVALPAARRGMLAAATLAWARALGEFGPVQVFAGATPGKTVVLPTAVFLEAQVGRLDAALAVSLVMVAVAGVVLVLTRLLGLRAGDRS
ncbi:MAG: ABC transporter permease subunit [Gemmataceae bacterium]|nr:ABC transporter permease subunit [Gemmataceae bacterium]